MAVASARARARAAVTAEILGEARRQLADVGPAALSLRSVARSVGMVSSGVYRYFASRDELLTVLIVEAYDSLGAKAEQAAERHAAEAPLDRWVAACRSVRRWARANPHEYALVYGTPVPGYRAPADTIGPAQRVTRALVGIVADAAAGGLLDGDAGTAEVPDRLAGDLRRISSELALDLEPQVVLRTVTAWSQLFGMISLELFGQTQGAVTAHSELFDATVTTMGRVVGLGRP